MGGIFAGIFLAVLVLVAGPLAERIPMPVIGGLVVVITGELIVGRVADIRLVLRTGALPTAGMVLTFLGTTQLALQYAIFLGAIVSLVLFCVNAQRQARLVRLERDDDGRWRAADVPAEVVPGSVVVLPYEGVSLFAEMARLDETWPVLSGARRSVVLLDVRTMPDVPSSTIVKALLRRAGQLRASGSRLVVVGADDVLARVFERTGLTAVLRPGDVRPGTPVLLEALDAAYDEAVAWVARAEDVPDPGTG